MCPELQSRPYRKRRRAEAEAQTRLRIAEAAMRLHGSVGPAQTTISAVAEQAGVQRATVYRHFATEEELFGACSMHWYSLHPPPDFTAWVAIADPRERLRTALAALYAWYGSDERMFRNILRDAEVTPAMRSAVELQQQAYEAMVDILRKGWWARGRRGARVAGAIGHAVAFPTWESLTRQGGMRDEEAIDVMLAAVGAAAEG